MMNILVTSIGSFSAAAVIDSLKQDKRVNKVYGCDIYPKEWHHVSEKFDNVFLAPYVSEENKYKEFILGLVKENDISTIIPLTDIDVDFFNKHRETFNNILITIGEKDFIEIARDKDKMNNFLIENNFKHPKTYIFSKLADAKYPIIGKPRNGRSSEGILYLNSREELVDNQDYSNYIFQEYIEGDVITVDVVRNTFTKEVQLIPRRELIRTKNGAGMTVELFHDKSLILYATKICSLLNAHGVLNMEFIQNKNSFYLIDINPRFSAGIGFSVLMGYDIVKNMLNVFLQEEIDNIKEYKNLIAQKKMIEVINKIIL